MVPHLAFTSISHTKSFMIYGRISNFAISRQQRHSGGGQKAKLHLRHLSRLVTQIIPRLLARTSGPGSVLHRLVLIVFGKKPFSGFGSIEPKASQSNPVILLIRSERWSEPKFILTADQIYPLYNPTVINSTFGPQPGLPKGSWNKVRLGRKTVRRGEN